MKKKSTFLIQKYPKYTSDYVKKKKTKTIKPVLFIAT